MQVNILIDSECRARLADFGLAVIVEDTTSDDGSNSLQTGGTARWMTLEILDPDKYGHTKWSREELPSKITGIYALGMMILEVRMGPPPSGSSRLFLYRWSRAVDPSNVPTRRLQLYRRS